jgi:DNA-binding beta-propeller fold protein YncE
MYIVDYMRHTITVYDHDGKYLFEFGGLGFDPGWFWFPNNIGVDKKGRVYVADFFNHRVQVFITRGIR